MDNQQISTLISVVALAVSLTTLYLTYLRRGVVRMTRPTIIFFGPDGSRGPAKVFLRSLLYCTAKRGRIIENMFIKLRRAESTQTFNIWVYGDRTESLVRGSGLFVGFEGVVSNHHFLLPKDGTKYEFFEGNYQLDVFATFTNRKNPLLLSRQNLFLTQDQANAINKLDSGVYFDWGPDAGTYHSHLDRNRTFELNYTLKEQVKLREKAI